MRNFNKRCGAWLAAAALFMGTASAAQAQVIWGAGSTNASSDSLGRFIGLSTTANQIHGWTAEGFTSLSNGSVANWESTTNTNSTYSDIEGSIYDLVSPSSADGMALFNSDAYYSEVYPQHAQLTSNTFSLAGYENMPLVLKFNTSIYEFQSDSLSVGISADNGATWNYTNLRSHLSIATNSSFNGEVVINITSMLANIADLSQCKVRFTFHGDSYLWLVDDISIGALPQYDITISGETDGSYLTDYFTTARVSNAVYTPFNQLSAEEFMMGVRALNQGGEDIPVALNPRIELTIEKEDAAGNWVLESTQTLPFDTIVPANGRVYAAEYLDQTTAPWMPTAEGTYRASYFVTHDGVDGSTANDREVQYFAITPANSVYSKVDVNTDGFPTYTTALGAGGLSDAGVITKLEWGSMFYFPNGAQTTLESVSFRAYASNTIAANFTTANVGVRVYQYTPNVNTGTLDDDPLTSGQLRLVGLGTVSIPTTPSGAKTGTANIIDVISEEQLVLQDGGIYYVSLIQDKADGLATTTGTSTTYTSLGVATQRGLNYGMNMAFMDAMPSVLSITEKVGNAAPETTWYGNGFGPSDMPSLMLNLADVTTVAVDQTANVNNLSLFPNPAAEVLNVNIALDEASDVQYIMTDVTGRIVRMITKANVQNETVSFNIEDLATGVYTLSVKSNKGTSTQKFVKK